MSQSVLPERQQRIATALTLAAYADWAGTAGAVPSHAVAQMLTLAGHLATGGVDEDRLAAELATTAWAQPEGQPRSGTQQILAAVAAGAAWWYVAPAHRNGAGSWGSDAAVRAGAAGLLPGSSTGVVAQLARRSATVTHTHPDARDAAAVHAAAVAMATGGGDFDDLDGDKLVSVLAGQCRGAMMRAQLNLVRLLARDCATPQEAAAVLGCGRSACGAAGASLAAYLLHPREPLQAISWVLQMGPRWHAAAVMTATVAGAHNPHARPPLTWTAPPALQATIAATSAQLSTAPLPVMRHHRKALTARCHCIPRCRTPARLSHNCHDTAGTPPYRPGSVAHARDRVTSRNGGNS